METFTIRPNNIKNLVINHIDGNQENNDLNNLEWCSQKENAIKAIDIGLTNYSSKEEIIEKFKNNCLLKYTKKAYYFNNVFNLSIKRYVEIDKSKIIRPFQIEKYNTLITLLNQNDCSMVKVGKILNISREAVRDFCERFGINIFTGLFENEILLCSKKWNNKNI